MKSESNCCCLFTSWLTLSSTNQARLKHSAFNRTNCRRIHTVHWQQCGNSWLEHWHLLSYFLPSLHLESGLVLLPIKFNNGMKEPPPPPHVRWLTSQTSDAPTGEQFGAFSGHNVRQWLSSRHDETAESAVTWKTLTVINRLYCFQ